MTKRPPPLRFEPFVAKLEKAQAQGSLDYVAANLPGLERLIAECMEWRGEIAGAEECRRPPRWTQPVSWDLT